MDIHGGVVEVEEGAEEVLGEDGGEHVDVPEPQQCLLPLQNIKEDSIKISNHHKSIEDTQGEDHDRQDHEGNINVTKAGKENDEMGVVANGYKFLYRGEDEYISIEEGSINLSGGYGGHGAGHGEDEGDYQLWQPQVSYKHDILHGAVLHGEVHHVVQGGEHDQHLDSPVNCQEG